MSKLKLTIFLFIFIAFFSLITNIEAFSSSLNKVNEAIKKGNFIKAVNRWHALSDRDKKSPLGTLLAGKLEWWKGNPIGAERYYYSLFRLKDKKIMAEALIGIATIEVANGRFKNAETHARFALKFNSALPMGWYLLSLALEGQNRRGEAAIAFEKFLELKPKDYPANIFAENGKGFPHKLAVLALRTIPAIEGPAWDEVDLLNPSYYPVIKVKTGKRELKALLDLSWKNDVIINKSLLRKMKIKSVKAAPGPFPPTPRTKPIKFLNSISLGKISLAQLLVSPNSPSSKSNEWDIIIRTGLFNPYGIRLDFTRKKCLIGDLHLAPTYKNITGVPFITLGGRLLVNTMLEGKKVFMMVDTTRTQTILSTIFVKNELSKDKYILKEFRETKNNLTKVYSLPEVKEVNIELMKIKKKLRNIGARPEVDDFSDNVGFHIGGILGMDFLSQFESVEVDYGSHTMLFVDKK